MPPRQHTQRTTCDSCHITKPLLKAQLSQTVTLMKRFGLVRNSTSPSPRQSKEVTHSADVSPTSARTTTAHSSTEDTPHSPAEANDSTAVLANLSPERHPTCLLTLCTVVPATSTAVLDNVLLNSGTTVPATSTAVLDKPTHSLNSGTTVPATSTAVLDKPTHSLTPGTTVPATSTAVLDNATTKTPFKEAENAMITDCLPFPPGKEDNYEESERGILDDDLLTIKQDKLFFSLKKEGLPPTAQLDSGATACLVSDDIYQSIPNKEALAIHWQQLHMIDHNQREIVQAQYPRVVMFTMGNFSIQHPVYVISNGKRNSFLAGYCLLQECQISFLNFGMDNVKLVLGNPQSPHTMLPTFNESSPVGQERVNVWVVENETVLKPLETTTVSGSTNSTAARDVIVRLQMSPLVIDESVQDLQARENTIAMTNRSLDHIIRQQRLDKILHHLTEKGIMDMGTSPWCSPAFIVPHRGEAGGEDKVRRVLDYRALHPDTEGAFAAAQNPAANGAARTRPRQGITTPLLLPRRRKTQG